MKKHGHQKHGPAIDNGVSLAEDPGNDHPHTEIRRRVRRPVDDATVLQGRLDGMRVNAEAIYKVIEVLGGASTVDEAVRAALDTLREAFGWPYGSFWEHDPKENVLSFALESGSINEEFRRVTMESHFHEGEGLLGRAWKTRGLYFQSNLGGERVQESLCTRAAQRAGVKSGVAFPILNGDQVVGTMGFFTSETLNLSDERLEALRNVGRLVSNALYALHVAEDAAMATADSQAINQVIEKVGRATTVDDAVRAALDAVREAFGWVHGTFWKFDPDENVLKFSVESGSINEEFRRATMAVRFREGEGLPGQSWKTRDLVFEPDLGQNPRFLRAAMARRTGVKSGVFFPILDEEGNLHGTIELLTTEIRVLTQRRLDALRNVGRLLSASIGRISKLIALVEADKCQRATTARLQEILAMVNQTSQTIASSSEQLSSSSQRMFSGAAETLGQASTVSAAAEEVSANVQTVAAGVEEMGASLKEIARNASEAAKVAAVAVSAANRTNETIAQLGESSAEIGKILKVITSIAGQTNLLALNATIEAARAGEAGKGFAVVANEVKELAKGTANASEDISRKIEAIQRDTTKAVQAIDQIGSIINQINDIQKTITGAVGEQTTTTNAIARNIAGAAEGSKEIARNITGVAKAASNTTAGADDIQKASKELARLASELQALVDQSGRHEAKGTTHDRGRTRDDHHGPPPSPTTLADRAAS